MEYLGTDKPVNKINPLVSVCVSTYQHGQYISQCLDSILEQEADFLFEIIIGEDESTDGTREICIEYAERHPDIIRLFLRSRKDVIYIDSKPTGRFNFIENMKSVRGKYVAVCDGDDYWCYRRKILNQVSFLENNADYAGVAHNILIKKNGKITLSPPKINFDIGTIQLLHGNKIPASSIMYRRKMLPTFNEDIYLKSPMADWPTHLFVSLKGKIRRLWNYWSVYRKHRSSIYSTLSKEKRLKSKLYSRELALDYLPDNEREVCISIIDDILKQVNE